MLETLVGFIALVFYLILFFIASYIIGWVIIKYFPKLDFLDCADDIDKKDSFVERHTQVALIGFMLILALMLIATIILVSYVVGDMILNPIF